MMVRRSFFGELKRRRVYRVALGYGVAASAIVQVGGTILPIFHAAEWVQQVFVVLIAIGFPFALVLAWAFDITSQGIERTPNVRGLRVSSGRQVWALAFVGSFIAALALSGYLFWHPWQSSSSQATGSPGRSGPPKTIAVLPFENRSADIGNTFFADGVQDQIITNLAKVSDLQVISHASVRDYKSGPGRNLSEIAKQLGVAYVLEGSVQRAPNQVRVVAQLSDARTHSLLWAENYEGDVADLFGIQSRIAQEIVVQLQAHLSPQQKADIEEKPTQDMEAFDLYLQAKEIVDIYLEAEDPGSSLRKAVRLLEAAIERDRNFVLAYCYAARAHSLLYFLDLDPTPQRDLIAEAALDHALRLKPNSAEAHLAKADHLFRCHREYDSAQQELAIARPGLPNSVPFFNLSGYINRRQGHWAEAERDFATAVKLNPRNMNAVNLLVDTFVLERRFPEAKLAYDRAIAIGMREPIALIRRAALDFGETGDPASLRAALAKAPEVDVGGGETSWRVLIALIDRDYDEAARVLAASPRQDFQDVDFSFYFPRAWYEAIIARAKGDRPAATKAFAAARVIFEKRLELKPDDPRTLAVLAQVDANLGKKEQGLSEAQKAAALMPLQKDAYDGPLVLQGLAQVYVWTGERDRALEVLRTLVGHPGYLSYGYLKADPAWEPLRADSRFAESVARVAPAAVK